MEAICKKHVANQAIYECLQIEMLLFATFYSSAVFILVVA